MNYQDIPFFIWSKEQTESQKIARIFGRQLNTHVESGEQKQIHDFIKNVNYFICYIFHLQEHLEDLLGIIKECNETGPLSPVILFSDHTVAFDTYQNAIRHGVEDILVFTKETNQIELRDLLLKILNRKWKAYRHVEKVTKSVYDATIVTANHELNQPLTVIMNAMTMIKMEIKRLGTDAKSLDKYNEMIVKSLGKIQDILTKFKNVNDPKLKKYTDGVPMLHLQEQSKEKQNLMTGMDRNYILVVESNEKTQENLSKSIRTAGYHTMFVSSGYEAIRLTRTMIHKLSAIMININISRVEIDEIKFELKLQNKIIPIIFHSAVEKENRIREVTESGLYKFLLLPFSKNELDQAIRQSNISLF
jgi:DNA-binding NtrC family response regulator